MIRRAASRSPGFTLIEVVVAMAIIVVVLAGLFFQINRVADTAFDLRQRTLAQWVALNRLTDLRLTGVPSIGQKPSGSLEFANAKWRWQAEVVATRIPGLVEIRVSVALESDPKDSWLSTVEGFNGNAMTPVGTFPQPAWRGTPAQQGGPGNGTPPKEPGGGPST
ncbi:MAG TPA: type II secretion system minor pseudopilin GspI [Steroidobacteraceae bacterium]|nr:type II secretion system minor pseudopilin GspI [Steroidobacteraceae bacterium]